LYCRPADCERAPRYKLLKKKKKKKKKKYKTSLDVAWAAACGDELCCVVVADASVPSGTVFQAAAAALVFRRGRQEAHVVSAAGRRIPPEVEHFALQLGISAALAKGCQKLVIFSDSLPAVKSLFVVELRSGQIFSLDACRAVGPWLAGDPDRSVHLWFIPSHLEWGVQKQAHDAAVALKIAVGRRPRTSRDFMLQRFDVEATKAWHERFKDPSYRGHSFLDLKGSKGRPLQPFYPQGWALDVQVCFWHCCLLQTLQVHHWPCPPWGILPSLQTAWCRAVFVSTWPVWPPGN
jgi:hypothetical protein